MQKKVVTYREWKPAMRNERVPFDVDAEVFKGSGIIETEDGEPIAAIVHLEDEARRKAKLLGNLIHRGIPWNDASKTTKGSARTSGIRYANQTFGTTAPQPMRRRYGCRYATFHEARPDIVELLGDVFYAGWERFQEIVPEKAEETWKLTTDTVHDDWRFADTPWTSGIINDIVSLPYHRDSGNIPGTWSAMVVMRKETDGSMLHLPEYNVALECGDMSMMYFNGQAAWHGVTPMRVKNSAAYRRSIVMYSKSGCKECGPKEQEATRAATIATKHDVPHDSPLKKREQ
jgi:hypothetical protein